MAGVLLSLLLLCVLCPAGSYLGYRRGWISSRTLFTLLGHGPGDIEITNLSETDLRVAVEILEDPAIGYTAALPVDLGPGDMSGYTLEPTRYQLSFKTGDGRQIGRCTLQIRSGDTYTLLAHGNEVYILRNEQVDPAGISIQNSGFCSAQEAP